MGIVANLAGLVTFVDWAVIKSRAKRQKQPLDQPLKALEKLEANLREISGALEGKEDLSQVEHHVNLLYEARAELIKDLRQRGIDIPPEQAPRVRGVSDEALLTMVSLCESGIIRARKELTET